MELLTVTEVDNDHVDKNTRNHLAYEVVPFIQLQTTSYLFRVLFLLS